MLLVDTNVIAPLYVRSARSHSVAELFARDAVWQTEPLALIELSNVLVSYERAHYITAARARASDCLEAEGRCRTLMPSNIGFGWFHVLVL